MSVKKLSHPSKFIHSSFCPKKFFSPSLQINRTSPASNEAYFSRRLTSVSRILFIPIFTRRHNDLKECCRFFSFSKADFKHAQFMVIPKGNGKRFNTWQICGKSLEYHLRYFDIPATCVAAIFLRFIEEATSDSQDMFECSNSC